MVNKSTVYSHFNVSSTFFTQTHILEVSLSKHFVYLKQSLHQIVYTVLQIKQQHGLTHFLTYSLTSIQIFRHVPVSYPHETYLLKLPNLNLSGRFSTLHNPRKKLCAKCRCTRNPLSGLGEISVKLNTKRNTSYFRCQDHSPTEFSKPFLS